MCCFYVPLMTEYSGVKMLRCSDTLRLGRLWHGIKKQTRHKFVGNYIERLGQSPPHILKILQLCFYCQGLDVNDTGLHNSAIK